MKLTINVTGIQYHRNGIGGEGFFAIRFMHEISPRANREFIATVFNQNGVIAVLTPADIYSCWRGDEFEPVLRKVCERYERRLGQGFGDQAVLGRYTAG